MSEQKKPAAAGGGLSEESVNAVLQEAAKVGSLSEAKFNALISLMMAKEARIAEKEALLEEQMKARDIERRRESERYAIAIIENQSTCRHLKGGASRKRSQQRDPAVYAHTFTNGDVYIKCTLCKAKWMPKDTAEFLFRGGRQVKNWTGIGWREAMIMAEESSNRPSSSERFFGTKKEKDVEESAHEASQTPNLQF